MNHRSDKIEILVFQTIGFVILPILSFITSVINYKSRISQVFFILFAFYFGWKIDCVLDLENHYANFRSYFIGHSLSDVFSNSSVYGIGKEPYHVLFKYIVGHISTNSHFFAGCAAAVYASIFILFFRQLRPFYSKRQLAIQFLIMCGIVFTVEYYWYLGLRYWTGAFFFLAFFIKYINSGKRKDLLISFCAVLFHAAHGIEILAVLIAVALQDRRKILCAIAAVSVIMKTTSNWMYVVLAKFPILKFLVKDSYYDSGIQSSIEERGEFFRSEGNFVYQMRSDVLFGTAVVLLVMLWWKNRKLNESYPFFYAVILSLFSVTNFLYMDIIAYERTFKLLIVLLFTYLYFLLQSKNNTWIGKNVFIVGTVAVIVIFSLLTAIIQQREYLMNLDVWFGSLWTM